jgi:hypothetical protein
MVVTCLNILSSIVWLLKSFLRVRLVRKLKLLGPLSRSIRSIQPKLLTKIITRMDMKLRDESIKSINHDRIRLVRFVSKIKVRVLK